MQKPVVGSETSLPDSSSTSMPRDPLLSCLLELRPRHHDILHDMSEAEEFLIDGESLFLEAVADPRCPCASGSPLQLVYWVESLLAKLQIRGGRFRIVFFRDYDLLWRSLPAVHAQRAVLISHLRRTLPADMVQVFKCWWPTSAGAPPPATAAAAAPDATKATTARTKGAADLQPGEPQERPPRFTDFLLQMRPSFLLTSDLYLQLQQRSTRRPLAAGNHDASAVGSSSTTSEEATLGPARPHAAAAAASLPGDPVLYTPQALLATRLCIGLLLRALRYTACVFISSLDFDATTPYGFMVQMEGASRMLRCCEPRIFSDTRKMVEEDLYGKYGARKDGGIPGNMGSSGSSNSESTAAEDGTAATPVRATAAQQATSTLPRDSPSNGGNSGIPGSSNARAAHKGCPVGAAKGKGHGKGRDSYSHRPLSATEADSVVLQTLQNLGATDTGARGKGSLLTPRTALAAAVCKQLLCGGSEAVNTATAAVASNLASPRGSTSCWKDAAGVSRCREEGSSSSRGCTVSDSALWVCELYLLHAVILDYTALEDRALALPRGAGMPPPASSGLENLTRLVDTFLDRSVLPLLAAVLQSDAWYGSIATAASLEVRQGSKACGGSSSSKSMGVNGGGGGTGNGGSGSSAGAGTGNGSCDSRKVAIAKSFTAVGEKAGAGAGLLPAANETQEGDGKKGRHRSQALSPYLAAALADPYHGLLLKALAAALLVMRSKQGLPAGTAPVGASSSSSSSPSSLTGFLGAKSSSQVPLLGLPPGAAETWQAARVAAGFQPIHAELHPARPQLQAPAGTAVSASSSRGADICYRYAEAATTGATTTPSAALPGELTEARLLGHLLALMPWDACTAEAAEGLGPTLLCRTVPIDGSGRELDGAVRGDEDAGPFALLDKRAHAVLLASAQLPESIRASPVVAAVRQAMEYGKHVGSSGGGFLQQQQQQQSLSTPAAATAPSGRDDSSAGRSRSIAAAATAAAASRFPGASDASITTSADADASNHQRCGGVHEGRVHEAYGNSAMYGTNNWGPWQHLVGPLLQRPEEADGGFEGGRVETRFHWHVRQPLEPAYMREAEDRDATIARAVEALYTTKNEDLVRKLHLFTRFMGRRYYFTKVRPFLLEPFSCEGSEGHDNGGFIQLRKLIKDGIEQKHVYDKNKEQAAVKRLIDSLQGGVTFFRQGGGGGGKTAAAAAMCGGGLMLPDKALPVLVGSLAEIVSEAHLEAIRADREGKAVLAGLLKAEQMSANDLRRRLEKADAELAVVQRRAAGQRTLELEAEAVRWRQAVLMQPATMGGAPTPNRLAAVDDAVQRFLAGASTPPELRSIAVALQLQLRLAIVREHWRRLQQQQQLLLSASEPTSQAAATAARSSSSGLTSGGANSSGSSHASATAVPVLGHLLTLPATAIGVDVDGRVKDAAASAAATASACDAAAGVRGDLPAVIQEGLVAMLKLIRELKSICRGGNRALWVQPCPLLADPRVGSPVLLVVCSALEALGFADAAQKLMQEAGWAKRRQLLALAKALDAKRKEGKPAAAGGEDGKQRKQLADGSGSSSSSVQNIDHAKPQKRAAEKGGSAKGSAAKTAQGSSTGDGSADVGLGAAAAVLGDSSYGAHPCLLGMYDKITRTVEIKPLPLGVSFVRFQLRCMGDLLERPVVGLPDPRVGFIPDEWQRRLLDVVDTGGSAVVSAPTSSGKTFISSYVVRKVLDAHRGHGRVVMVVPTKVLVTQVRAQMAKDFHSERNLPPGMVLEGAFTRDFRCNALNSVVLVTVPQCLEILLLSPAHRTWVESVKYVIYDEIGPGYHDCVATRRAGRALTTYEIFRD